MKHKKANISVALLLLGLGLHSQETVLSSGGEATGTGGTASYSLGQVVYTTYTGTNVKSIAQGVQQPFEISTTISINENYNKLKLSVYPNPTTNYLTLEAKDNSNLSYQLYDLQGKIIERKTVNNKSTKISLEGKPTAIYFLNIVKNNQVIKTFKIIKK